MLETEADEQNRFDPGADFEISLRIGCHNPHRSKAIDNLRGRE
jgi:hypothetical protein